MVPDKELICGVVPAFNERKRIEQTIRQTLPYVDRLVVVDDGSQDETFPLASTVHDPKLHVVRHRVNLGKGAALKTGCEAARRLGATIIVTLDGDGQHPPQHVPEIVSLLRENNYEIVFTVRSGGDRMPFVRRVGNTVLNQVAFFLFRLRLRDIWCGFRVFRTEIVPRVLWKKTDYSGEIEMALKVGHQRLRYGEFIIPTIYHDANKGVTIFNGLKLLCQMIIWRLTLLR